MRRRHLLAARQEPCCPPAWRRPALAATAKTLIFVPQANLTSLDPVWTTAAVTRNSAHMVFETLYGRDETAEPAAADGRRPHDRG